MSKVEYVYGIHPVIQILSSGRRQVWQLFVDKTRKGKQMEELARIASKRGIGLTKVDGDEITRLVPRDANHQGVVLKTEKMSVMSLADAIDAEENPQNAVWLALDEVTDPQNLGAILRSAACLGVSTVVLPTRRTVGITAMVHKAACGALEHLRIAEVGNLNQAILQLRDKGFWIYGTDMGGTPLNKVSYAKPLLLVIGSEGTGIRQKTTEHCHEVLSIPQKGGVESLNAACACSIILYDIASKTAKGK
jgi:23S rRNA (guanosine2251-2'-O)-methyltransferase